MKKITYDPAKVFINGVEIEDTIKGVEIEGAKHKEPIWAKYKVIDSVDLEIDWSYRKHYRGAASVETILKRCQYNGRKGRSARRKLRLIAKDSKAILGGHHQKFSEFMKMLEHWTTTETGRISSKAPYMNRSVDDRVDAMRYAFQTIYK